MITCFAYGMNVDKRELYIVNFRYRDSNDDGYRGDPHDRYDDRPPNQSFQQDPRDYVDSSYPQDPDRRHEGLPQVQDDPFADDPFRQKQRSLLQLQSEDPYPRGPSPGAGSDRMGNLFYLLYEEIRTIISKGLHPNSLLNL